MYSETEIITDSLRNLWERKNACKTVAATIPREEKCADVQLAECINSSKDPVFFVKLSTQNQGRKLDEIRLIVEDQIY